jgi:hypothetical protein
MTNVASADQPRNGGEAAPAKYKPTPPVVIGVVDLNSRDRLRASFDTFSGRLVFDLRKWFQPDGGGDIRPTPKGLTIALERLPVLAELVNAALVRARADGLIPSDTDGAAQ